MGCNCGKKNPVKKVECVGCGKVTSKNSPGFKKYWMRCPECKSATKFCCGTCLVTKGYKVQGLGKKKTPKYNETLKATLSKTEKKEPVLSDCGGSRITGEDKIPEDAAEPVKDADPEELKEKEE